ncbi:hypothetical protein P3X46_010878 [Hevea brasiliensis]|uniref:Pectate lyase superfamily protein domain-containing protein n=1 Tax=Hevea brasiliensis TaxID=3981 RepID=A0ABQ9MFF7_HEVBR|nr:hypothetical protein P3X46_010878 [Hevea brasiliensis]
MIFLTISSFSFPKFLYIIDFFFFSLPYPFTILYILSLVSAMFNVVSSSSTYNVLSYGAVGNGNADDTLAFVRAWNDTCKDSDTPTMIIPEGNTFLVYPITLLGPCNSSKINVQLSGKIIAPDDPNDWKGKDFGEWLTFRYVNGLEVAGGGLLNGRGQAWWNISCKHHPGNILRFEQCKNVKMRGIRTVQSGGCHLAFYGYGIHISHSSSVSINNSVIGSGDDCISMLDRSYNISITYVHCGHGHGISIGSLDGDGIDVKNITISNVNFYNTTNGARIKTWPDGSGEVPYVKFSNINFTEVQNPIIIGQHYGKIAPKSRIHISEIRYHRLYGTSKTPVAINFNCSDRVPCTNISLENIGLTSATSGDEVVSSCNNAFGHANGNVKPKSCLQ